MRRHAKAPSAGSIMASGGGARLAAMLVAAMALLAFAAPAQASSSRTELPALFHETGGAPCGVTTDSVGNHYVSNVDVFSGVNKVKVFDPSGSPLVEFSTPETPCNLAVDTLGRLYADAGFSSAVTRYAPSKFPPDSGTTYSVDTSLNGTGKLVASGSFGIAVNPGNGRVLVGEASTNEVQKIEVAKATGGTYTLTFKGATTSPLASSSTSANVASALNGLSTIGGVGGSVTVSGAAGNTTLRTRTVTFGGSLAFTNVPGIEVNGAALTCTEPTPGCPASIANTTTTPGAPGRISSYEPNGTLVNITGSGVSGASYYGVDAYGANGRIYATDIANDKAYVFEAGAATAIAETNGSEAAGGPFSWLNGANLAVDQTNGNFLVSDVEVHGVVDEFNPAGKFVSQISHSPAFQYANPTDVAVDNSATANKGNVYIGSGVSPNGSVYAYGALEPTFTLTRTTFGEGTGGSIKCNLGIGAEDCVSKYAEGEKITLTAVDGPSSKFKEWSGGNGSAISCNGSKVPTCAITLNADSAIKAEFEISGPQAPLVVTGSATAAKTTATLNGTVNPRSSAVSDCHFEYGTAPVPPYSSTAPCVPASPGEGTSAVPVSASLSSLTPGTTYHFRLVATNGVGTVNGNDATVTTEALKTPIVTTTSGATGITPKAATVAGTVNPNGLNVTACKVKYGTTTSYGSEADCASLPGSGSSPVAVSKALAGLTPNTTYHFNVFATNADGTSEGTDQTFATDPLVAPVVLTQAATGVTKAAATLNGTVNPKEDPVSVCKFEYGTSTSYGSTAPCVPANPGEGDSPVSVSASISGLSASTTYHFRLVATNGGGTTNGSDLELTTPADSKPIVTTTAGATGVTKEASTVAGTVNPNGLNVTACKVKYGLTTTYTGEADCASLPGSGSSPVAVSKGLTGLTPNTTYHFRFFATNADGTSEGTDQEFKTLVEAPTVTTTAGASAITPSTATVAGTVNPNSGNVTACKVKYGLTTTYTGEADCASLPGSGSSPVAVSKGLASLTPNTTYHFRFFATNAGGTGEGTDQTFTTTVSAPTVTTTAGATEIAQTTAKVAGTVNPNSGLVSDCHIDYGTTTSYGSSAPCVPSPGSGSSAVAVSASLSALSAKTLYHFRVVATNPGGTTNGSDQSFTTLPEAPVVITTAGATAITQSTATLAGTVNPNGGAVSACTFEYGTTTSYGKSAPCVPASPGSGTSPVAVSASLTALTANTTYHFRLRATNPGGVTNGSDQTFATPVAPPTVTTTNGASDIAQTSAKVGGTVNPNSGALSECKIEYGTSASYGSEKPCASLPGSGSSPVGVSAQLSGLNPNTTYHFRVVATNPGGTTNGPDRTFTTLADTCETESSLCPPAQSSPAAATPAPTPTATKPPKCKKGFKRKTVKGKARCVKVKHRKAHKKHRRPHGKRRAS